MDDTATLTTKLRQQPADKDIAWLRKLKIDNDKLTHVLVLL
jgi:hypothetical protein